ncbi:MAG: carbamoyltransferase HypF [Bacteroidota bacterium]
MRSWEIHIAGRVQGVGFRPFVYRLACAQNIVGEVRNGPDGVRIRCQGTQQKIAAFTDQILANLPPMAIVTHHNIDEIVSEPYDRFSITDSQLNGKAGLFIAPDFCLCSDCRRELLDPTDRRFAYAFITCTNCGPRYAVQQSLPYDRERTAMAKFRMCADCQREYESPDDRRYHSQTNSCPSCGPQWQLLNQDLIDQRAGNLEHVADLIKDGSIIAVKGTSGYLLCCDATDERAVKELRRRKARPQKPFALLVVDLGAAQSIAHIIPKAEAALSSPAAPIVLLPKRQQTNISDEVAPDSAYYGLMLPNQGLTTLLARAVGRPMVATSANLSGEPILAEGQEREVARLANYVLTHDLPIVQAQDDSLIRFSETAHRPIIIRRGRGLAPAVHPSMAMPAGTDMLAMGSDMKACFGLRSSGQYVLSPRLGELGQLPAQVAFKKTLQRLTHLSAARLQVILTDLHPAYFSRSIALEMAEEQALKVYAVQHHEAHFAALLGEQNLLEEAEEVLGVVWDGLGYGHDGQIWGGEFFRLREDVFHRVAQLPYFPHIGGDKMALDPRYAAVAWVGDPLKNTGWTDASMEAAALDTLMRLRNRTQTQTSSVGRLFDAVAALTGVCIAQDYEGQAASRLEAAARAAYDKYGLVEAYHFHALQAELLEDLGHIPAGLIALKFHLSLVQWIGEVAENQSVTTLACSGGCFQNALLVDLIEQQLGGQYRLAFHEHLAPNDENIAYGQLIHYALTQEAAITKNQKTATLCV